MNQYGPPHPETRHPGMGSSWHENTLTSHLRSPHRNANNINDGRSTLLLACANNDRGGGVSLDYVFAIYSTAILPPVWRDILHATALSAAEVYVEKLETLAMEISESLPIYTSWSDVRSLSASSRRDHQIQTLSSNLSLLSSPETTFSTSNTNLITIQKPYFLINAALHERHCIIGRDSLLETLLVILRRPWCVLEICVSNLDNTDVLEVILAFVKTAQELDCSGYSTAVFLLEYEIGVRRYYHHRQAIGLDHCAYAKDRTMRTNHFDVRIRKASSSRGVYELCNTVFLPSLKSFNSFWICLICVSAMEIGVSLSCMIHILCGQQQEQIYVLPSLAPTGLFRSEEVRRQSETNISSFVKIRARDQDGYNTGIGDGVVEDMLKVYRCVLRRTGDYI